MIFKEHIRSVLKSIHPSSYRIKEVKFNNSNKKKMNKKTFIEVVKQLKQIEDRRDFMETELGLDMTTYEDKFFNIIESLFKLVFSKGQLALVQMYLYQLAPDNEWNGKITIEIDKKEKEVDFKTPEQVWEVLKVVE